MTPEELEDLAFRKQPVPDLKSQAQLLLYHSFRNLYDFAGRVGMAPEQGKREKAQILKAYNINKFLEEINEETDKMWKRIDVASSEYALNPTIENADKLYRAVYRVDRKEKTK